MHVFEIHTYIKCHCRQSNAQTPVFRPLRSRQCTWRLSTMASRLKTLLMSFLRVKCSESITATSNTQKMTQKKFVAQFLFVFVLQLLNSFELLEELNTIVTSTIIRVGDFN